MKLEMSFRINGEKWGVTIMMTEQKQRNEGILNEALINLEIKLREELKQYLPDNKEEKRVYV